MSNDILFLPLPLPPHFKNIMKTYINIFYLSFSFYNMQIDFFAFLLVALIIVQLESALNSLYSHTAKSIHYSVWTIAKFNS